MRIIDLFCFCDFFIKTKCGKICSNMKHTDIRKRFDGVRYFRLIALLVIQISGSAAFGQCPESTNFWYDYISTGKVGEISDWDKASTWKTSFWVKPKCPPSFGKIKGSIAINGSVVLHNKGFSIEFNQLSKICGNLTIEGKLIVSGGCSPLNVHGKLIVYGDLETSQSILVWPGGEVIVYGNWIVKGGANPIIMGKMAVKGSVESKFGLNVAMGGLFITFGNYTSKNGLGLINDDYIVNGNISIPSWSFKLGIGDIYCFGSSGNMMFYKFLNKSDLQKNFRLYSEYLKYQNLFWPIPSKYVDLNVISEKDLQEYSITGCVTDSTRRYKTSIRNRIYLDSRIKNKYIVLKFNETEKKELKMTLDDSLWVDGINYGLSGENRVLDKLYYEKNNRLVTVYLNGRTVNDVKITGLQGIQKISGQSIVLDGVKKDEVRSLSVYSMSDMTKPVLVVSESNSWDGKDQTGRELSAGVYLLKVDFKNGKSITGQFIIK